MDGPAIGRRVAVWRVRRKWSRRALAEVAEVSASYVSLLEKGDVGSPGIDKVEALARALCVPFSRLLRDDDPDVPLEGPVAPVAVDGEGGAFKSPAEYPARQPLALPVDPAQRRPLGSFAVLLLPVVAQPAVANADGLDFGGSYVESFVAVPQEWAIGRTLRAVRVTGDCLAPETGIHSGDVVVLDVGRPPQNGDVVCATLRDRGVTVIKRYFQRGDRLELRPDVGELVLTQNELVQLEGVVVWHIRAMRRTPDPALRMG